MTYTTHTAEMALSQQAGRPSSGGCLSTRCRILIRTVDLRRTLTCCRWNRNVANMQISCDQWQVARNSPSELTKLRKAIARVSKEASLDPRFVLAIVIQESQGCVRVPTTFGSHANPGLMQSYNGNGSCNTGNRVKTPCPYSEIHRMIKDGTLGTPFGPGLTQDYRGQGRHGGAAYYRTARIYNSGSIPSNQDLSGPTSATVSYASDIANRLTGWVYAPRAFSG